MNLFVLILFRRVGTRWIGKFILLFLYAIFLLPGFIQGICPYHSLELLFVMIGFMYFVFRVTSF
jgi:hypothetical protein